MKYSQGLMQDGAAILQDGQLLTVDEIVKRLNDYHGLLKPISLAIFKSDNKEKTKAIIKLTDFLKELKTGVSE